MSKRLTTSEIVTKFKIKHGNKGGYSKVVYHGMAGKGTAVKIFCRNHGEYFWDTPINHLNRWNCYWCNPRSNSVANNLLVWYTESELQTFAEMDQSSIHPYMQLASQLYDNFHYDYSNIQFTSVFDPVEILCQKHQHIFFQSPINHVRNIKKSGCPFCASVSRRKQYFDHGKAKIYYIQVNGKYKIVASTKKVKDEFGTNYKNISVVDIIPSETQSFADGVEALEEEQVIMAKYEQHLILDSTLLRGYKDNRYFDIDVLGADTKGTKLLF